MIGFDNRIYQQTQEYPPYYPLPTERIRPRPRPKEVLPTTELSTTPTFNDLAYQLTVAQLNWERLGMLAQERAHVSKSANNLNNFKGILLEMHVQDVVDSIAADNPDAIETDPFFHGLELREHSFRQEPSGNVVAYRTSDRTEVAEYDELILLHDQEGIMPVVFEVKGQSKYRPPYDPARHGRVRRPGLADAMCPPFIDKKLRPLTELVHTFTDINRIGYGVVTTRDLIDDIYAEQSRFQDFNGMLIPLPFTYAEFTQGADSLLSAYNAPSQQQFLT